MFSRSSLFSPFFSDFADFLSFKTIYVLIYNMYFESGDNEYTEHYTFNPFFNTRPDA